MSRNKENVPTLSSKRSNSAFVPSAKQPPSDEFFTDSLLDATRLSQIPSPSPQKPSLTRPRRARTTKAARNALNPLHRPSLPENGISRPKNPQPATPLRHGTAPSRLRTQSLTTPPASKDDLPFESPYSSISSPPPQDLAASYRQIEDEEDLAQTERELSSDDGNDSGLDDSPPARVNQRSYSESPYKAPPTFTIPSAASTPTRSFSNIRRDQLVDRTEALSEASGLSFLKDLTDQRLAEKLTPHVSQSAKDRVRMRAAWNTKPVAFRKAEPLPKFDSGTEDVLPVPRVVAFSKASKPLPSGLLNGQVYEGHGERPLSQQSGTENLRSDSDTRRTNDFAPKPLRTNKIERNFNFSTNHGFPLPRTVLTEKNLEQQNRGGPGMNSSLSSQNSAPSLHSESSSNNARVLLGGLRSTSALNGRLPPFQRSTAAEENGYSEGASQIDWAAAAADVPIPSVETSLISEKKDLTPMSTSKMYSPEKTRMWNNDFTGQSFQVSESPPVRHQPIINEQKRGKEIEGIAKHAVTTNRLSEIRERQSLESMRGMSRSPEPRSISHSSEQIKFPATITEVESEVIAQPVPDTPVVVYRSNSNGSGGRTSGQTIMDRPEMDRSQSDNQLQRLARAMSSTPRSSPASGNGSRETEAKAISSVNANSGTTESTLAQPLGVNVLKTSKPVPFVPAQTPKVIGAWTDTILPDTIRTAKQIDKKLSYAQTPHVNAGGWIDTPAPADPTKYSRSIPTIVEEVPEELMNGIVKDNSSDAVKVEVSELSKDMISLQPGAPIANLPKSALASILDKQRNRLVSQDITTATREDTLNLGNDTIESLQDLLALDEDELTTLSRLSALDDETKPLDQNPPNPEVMQRLSAKISHLHKRVLTTGRGISKIEHQVIEPSDQVVLTPQRLLDTSCSICQQQPFLPHTHTYPEFTSKFPHMHLTFTLPIPLLFKPRTANQRLPRPTILGATILTFWTWYLLECIMCEFYCRPTYTDYYVWPEEREPEFPYVIPTMLGRWTRLNRFALGPLLLWLWSLVSGLVTAVYRIIGMSMGWSDGFVVDDVQRNVVSKIVQTTATAIVGGLSGADNIDLSMNDDEYI